MLKELFQAFLDFFKELFEENKKEKVVVAEIKTYGLIKYNSKNAQAVKYAKKRLNAHGFGPLDEYNPNFLGQMLLKVKAFQKAKGLTSDGEIGPKTWAELNKEPVKSDSKDYMQFFETHKGKTEHQSVFNKFMSTFWPKTYNPKTIAGSAAAWCGVFVFAALSTYGYKNLPTGYIAAISWDKYGYAVNWKEDGIARGAVIRINSSGNCKSSSGNHVTFANGYCTAKDLTKAGATIGGAGGNQSDSVKVSIYRMANVCYVGWPKEKGLPPKVTKSVNCTGTGPTNESTR